MAEDAELGPVAVFVGGPLDGAEELVSELPEWASGGVWTVSGALAYVYRPAGNDDWGRLVFECTEVVVVRREGGNREARDG